MAVERKEFPDNVRLTQQVLSTNLSVKDVTKLANLSHIKPPEKTKKRLRVLHENNHLNTLKGVVIPICEFEEHHVEDYMGWDRNGLE